MMSKRKPKGRNIPGSDSEKRSTSNAGYMVKHHYPDNQYSSKMA
ncbi:MAG TPA: hypothetical protein VGG71_02635 [Chitinophagaceae bacterium]